MATQPKKKPTNPPKRPARSAPTEVDPSGDDDSSGSYVRHGDEEGEAPTEGGEAGERHGRERRPEGEPSAPSRAHPELDDRTPDDDEINRTAR